MGDLCPGIAGAAHDPHFSSPALSPLVRPEAMLLSRNVELSLGCLGPEWGSVVLLPPTEPPPSRPNSHHPGRGSDGSTLMECLGRSRSGPSHRSGPPPLLFGGPFSLLQGSYVCLPHITQRQLALRARNQCDKGSVCLPRRVRGKESACQCWRCRRLKFYPWVWKIPWRRK